MVQIRELQRHAGILVFCEEAQLLLCKAVVDRQIKAEGEFFIRADTEVLGQRIAVVVHKVDSFAVPYGVQLDLVQVEYLTEGAVQQDLSVAVIENVQTDPLSLHTRDDYVVDVEGDVLVAFAQVLGHFVESRIVLEHIEHLGGFFAVAQRLVFARVEDDRVVQQVEYLFTGVQKAVQLLGAHVALVAVVHVGEESRRHRVHQVELDVIGEGAVGVFEALSQRQQKAFDALAVPLDVVGGHEVRRVVAQRHKGVEVRLAHRVVGRMIALQAEHHVVEIFEFQRRVGGILLEDLALDDVAVRLHLQQVRIIADIRDRVLLLDRDVGAADIFVAGVNGIDAKALRRREGVGLIEIHRLERVHEVVTAEDVARTRQDRAVAVERLQRGVIRFRLVGAGHGNDPDTAEGRELFLCALLLCGVRDQKVQLRSIHLMLIFQRVGGFQDQV